MSLAESMAELLEADMPASFERFASHLDAQWVESALLDSMQLLILPERRSERRYKRHVKIKMSGYKRNPGRSAAKTAESKGKELN